MLPKSSETCHSWNDGSGPMTLGRYRDFRRKQHTVLLGATIIGFVSSAAASDYVTLGPNVLSATTKTANAHAISGAGSLQLAQTYSCSIRKTCSREIGSCEEARWYLANCSWGGRLDRDNDGVPCENLCPGG